MLVDLQKKLGDKGDLLEVVLDNYTLANGVYVILNEDGSYIIKNIIKECPDFPELDWLKKADYFSYLLEMNKSVDDKKQIHSCNPYSVFIKLDRLSVIKGAKNPASLIEVKGFIEYYYNIFLKDSKLRYKAKDIELLESANLPDINLDEVNKYKNIVLSSLEGILEEVGGQDRLPKNAYLKILLFTDIDKYKQEWMRYVIPKIFNKNDFNIEVDGKIFGLSNFNMGMNSKKPYLKLYSTDFEVPFRIGFEEALKLKYIFDWMENYKSDGKPVNNLYIQDEFNFYDDLSKISDGNYIAFERGINLEISDYDYIPQVYNPKEKFQLINITDMDNWDYDEAVFRPELEWILSEIFFNRSLVRNYFTKPSDIKDKFSENDYSKSIQNLMIIYRKSLFDYFKKSDDTSIKVCFDRMSMEIIIEYIKISKNARFYKAAKALNLRISLLEHFKIGRFENMADILESYYEKLKIKMLEKDKPVICEDNIEFFFTAGQLTSYLLSMSEKKDIKHSASDVITNSKDIKILKSKLKDIYLYYNHAISFKNSRFNNLFSMVMGYESEAVTKDYLDIFLTGLTRKNLLYEKKEDKNND